MYRGIVNLCQRMSDYILCLGNLVSQWEWFYTQVSLLTNQSCFCCKNIYIQYDINSLHDRMFYFHYIIQCDISSLHDCLFIRCLQDQCYMFNIISSSSQYAINSHHENCVSHLHEYAISSHHEILSSTCKTHKDEKAAHPLLMFT